MHIDVPALSEADINRLRAVFLCPDLGRGRTRREQINCSLLVGVGGTLSGKLKSGSLHQL